MKNEDIPLECSGSERGVVLHLLFLVKLNQSSVMADQRSFTYDVLLLNLSSGGCFEVDLLGDRSSGTLSEALDKEGIRTFITEYWHLSRHIGGEITPAPTLVEAMEESRIAIVVFEDDEGFSCDLELLAYILDYFQRNHRPIFPVYYMNRIDAYNGITTSYELPSDGKLSKALRQVSGLPGWDLDRKKMIGYDTFNKGIASMVSSVLFNCALLHVADHPVGLESRLEEVLYSYLEFGSYHGEALMVGFYGDPGIGKTTLARAVYNRIALPFEGCCFLNVREDSKHGLVHLQSMLLSKVDGEKDTQIGNVDIGVSVIKHKLQQKKVLLILDDVDELEQLEALVGGADWFGPGSRVIITTRNIDLLVHHGVLRRYEVKELSKIDALELLRHKAFQQGIVDPSYTQILDKIVTYTRVPLTLERIGSDLSGKSVVEWGKAFDRFTWIPHGDIPRIHEAIVNALERAEQSVPQEISQSVPGVSLTPQSVPEVSQTSQSVREVSHTTQRVHEVSQTPQSAPEVSQNPPQSALEQSVSQGTSQSALEVVSHEVDVVSQTYPMVAQVKLRISRVFLADKTYRVLGLVSGVVGFVCHFLSHSFTLLFRGWNPLKWSYVVFSVGICAAVLFAKPSQFSIKHRNLIGFVAFVIITGYSIVYDKAVDGKPDILSVVANLAFALVSLSLSKLVKSGFETGMFSYFLGNFTEQVWTINKRLIWVAIIVDFLLFFWHSSSYPQPDVDDKDQTIPLSTPNSGHMHST